MYSVFRRGNNSWQVVLNTTNVTWDVSEDGEFSALPQYGTAPNASENSRRCAMAINGTIRTWLAGNGNNSLLMDLVFQFRLNNADVVGVTMTITAGIVAVFTVEDLVIPIVITDTIGFRGDFDDPAEPNSSAFNNTGVGGT